jgi:hypothetical protein
MKIYECKDYEQIERKNENKTIKKQIEKFINDESKNPILNPSCIMTGDDIMGRGYGITVDELHELENLPIPMRSSRYDEMIRNHIKEA